MIKKRRNTITLLLLIWAAIAMGQDVSFSQFYTNPIYLNPAFSGSVGVPRTSLQYRNQWHAFQNAYTTYSAALDLPVKVLRGGIGINILNDAQGNNLINALQANFSYSVHLQNKKVVKDISWIRTNDSATCCSSFEIQVSMFNFFI